MAEEVRFFLRTAIYTAVIAVVYWFVSPSAAFAYDYAGTVMLAFVSVATILVVAVVFFAVKAARGELDPKVGSPLRRALLAVSRAVGFSQPRRDAAGEPLAAGLEPIPSGSIWPPIAGGAALLIGLGLVYGPWLLFPGIALAAVTVWGWLTQMDPR